MNLYVGTFLIALATLALEIALSRLLSVITWYHLAFFAISTAMLGMTAGATTVYLKSGWFTREKLSDSLTKACLGFSIITPCSLMLLCFLPMYDTTIQSVMSFAVLILPTLICLFPFYFSGLAIAAILTKVSLPVGKLYASDLLGASLGCLFVLVGLEVFDAPSLIIVCASIGAVAGLSFAWRNCSRKLRRTSTWIAIILLGLGVLNSLTLSGIRPLFAKGSYQAVEDYLWDAWNSFSHVVVYKQVETIPHLWGPSPLVPETIIPQYLMVIDGAAGTVLGRFSSLDDIRYLRFDVTNIAYYLRPEGGACIIGVGGGRDVQSALLFGHERIIGIDVNPIFIRLLQEDFKEFAGLAGRQEVRLIADEARSVLSSMPETFSIIQMSLIDTWAATGAGAFSLSENGLYTTDAWKIVLDRLAEDGIFTVSRWHSPENLGETGRIISLAVASLLQYGIDDPSQHIALITQYMISTLLMSKQPFTPQEIAELQRVTADLQFHTSILPTVTPENSVLQKIVAAKSLEELHTAIADEVLNYTPPTDENPYFFNMLRMSRLGAELSQIFGLSQGVIRGNLVATLTLVVLIISLLVLAFITIVWPLMFRKRVGEITAASSHILWPGAFYFSLIGAGFMFVEIAMIQRLSVFLGHPTYALAILLFTIILSAGLGSFLSEYVPLTRPPWIYFYPVTTAIVILVERFLLNILAANMVTSPIFDKIIVSIGVIFPLGILLGLFFPTGMRLARSAGSEETPWFWGLNGIFGVLCSALAVFFSIYFGIFVNFYIAACCYAGVTLCLYKMYSASRSRVAEDGDSQQYSSQKGTTY